VARGGDERVLKAGDGTINGPFSAILSGPWPFPTGSMQVNLAILRCPRNSGMAEKGLFWTKQAEG
jgi:hypothetical protein